MWQIYWIQHHFWQFNKCTYLILWSLFATFSARNLLIDTFCGQPARVAIATRQRLTQLLFTAFSARSLPLCELRLRLRLSTWRRYARSLLKDFLACKSPLGTSCCCEQAGTAIAANNAFCDRYFGFLFSTRRMSRLAVVDCDRGWQNLNGSLIKAC